MAGNGVKFNCGVCNYMYVGKMVCCGYRVDDTPLELHLVLTLKDKPETFINIYYLDKTSTIEVSLIVREI